MTMQEILESKKDILSATDVSEVLHMHPSKIVYYIRNKEWQFSCHMSGNRSKIPRMDFIRWMGYAADGGVNNGQQ